MQPRSETQLRKLWLSWVEQKAKTNSKLVFYFTNQALYHHVVLGESSVEKEENDDQKEHFKPIFQRVFFVWSSFWTDTSKFSVHNAS